MKVPGCLLVVLALSAVFMPSVSSQACTAQEDKNLRQNCVDSRSSGSDVCSGRGDCSCGVCSCHTRSFNTLQRYSGQYCQCDDFSCPFFDSKLCGGQGLCECGLCNCFEGRTGKACECSTSKAGCMASNGKVCNGSGNCVCGACKCSSWTGFYGPTCEDCPDCVGQCDKHVDCVLCKAFNSGSYDKETCDRMCTNVATVNQQKMREEAVNDQSLKHCKFIDDKDKCSFEFAYKYIDNRDAKISVLDTKDCPDIKPSSLATWNHQQSSSVVLVSVCGAILLRLKP